MSFDLHEMQSLVERKCKALRQKECIPVSLVDFVQNIMRLQLETRASLGKGLLPPDIKLVSAERHGMGVALLGRGSFPLDEGKASTLYSELAALARNIGGVLEEEIANLEKAEKEGLFHREELFKRFLDDDTAYFDSLASLSPQTPSLPRFLAQATATPFAEAVGELVSQQAENKGVWPHGHCPVCGSMPIIGRLMEKEGFRHLTCSFCHTEYRSVRLQCPFCCEEDMEKLEYFEAAEEPGFQVHVCKSCKTYIKTVDFRKLDKISVPLLDDLESLPLDVLAAEKGFSRPVPSAWGF